jgi:deoxyribose-phosphate aldolase
MREACGHAHLKAILATGDLQTLRNVYAASMVAMQAGADFIKTSTGKEGVNATLPVSSSWCARCATIWTRPATRSASSRPAA